MAHAKRTARKRTARIPLSDEELIARLQDEAPDALRATIPEALHDAAVEGLLKESPSARDRPHFYCRKCGEYHLKTHPHYHAKSP
jgi:Fe2+ or Zn2+ uptake regulation protein